MIYMSVSANRGGPTIAISFDVGDGRLRAKLVATEARRGSKS
jgi:hypothetical protein